MATINHSSGADIIVPSNSGDTYRGLAGDDTYIISNGIAANATITIVDTSGSNKIQLVDGLGIASSKFAADAVQLTLTNGAVVTINGASNFSYELGGNATSGTTGSSNTLAAFAASMGVATLPSSGSTDGSSDISISSNGVSSSASPTFTVSKDTSKVTEGESVTFTITASSAVSADTSFSWSAMGDTNGSTVTAATNADISVLSGTATIASGSTSTTFAVGAVGDATVEGLEGMKVSVFDTNAVAVSSDVVLIDNTGSAATVQSFSGTTGVNNFTGGEGNDSFDFSTSATFQDIDAIDGAGGTDTLTVTYAAAATLKPDLENVEKVVISNTAGSGNTLTINAIDTAAGYSEITNLSSTGHLTINNLQNLPTLVTLNNSSDTLTLDLEAATLAGTADNLDVTISGTASAATNLTITADGTANLETLTLNSISQANTIATLTTADVDVSKLIVTGDQNLTVTNATSGEITEVDASAFTGSLTLSAAPGVTAGTGVKITGGAGNDSVLSSASGADTLAGGAGNDTFTVTSLNALDAVDGGAGSDTLSIAQAITSATQLGGVSNVETLTVTSATDVALAANISATTFNFVDTDNQVLTVDEGYTDAVSVVFATYAGGDTTNPADGFVNLANVTSTVTHNTLGLDTELTLTGGTGTDTLNLYLGGNADETLVNSVSGFEAINLLDNPLGNTATTLTFGAYAPGTGKNITIDASTLDALDAALVIDASGVTAATTGKQITYTDGANAGKITLGQDTDTANMGAGNDTVVGTAGANTINLGDGVDSVTAGTGAENISGGAGNDYINMGGNLTALDTIDGGDGTDTLLTTASIASSTILGGMSNVEVLAATGATSITLAANISATTFNFAGTGNQVLNLKAGYTDSVTVILTGDGGGDKVDNAGVTEANTTLLVKGDATDFTAGTSLAGGTGTDSIEIRQTNGTATIDGDITGFENVTITDKAGDNTSDITLTMTSYATAATIDASALDTGEDDTLSLTSGTAAFTIKGGDGVSTITGGSLGDTITGNGGADVLVGGSGLDNISGGAGNDSITAATEATFLTTLGTDTVDGGAGTDTLTFSAAATLTTAEVANISNVEILSLTTGSTLTVNDAFLAANAGLVIRPGASSTIKGSTATGDSLSTSLNITANAAGNLSVLGGTGDDSFTFFATESLTNLDSINGGTGTDTIYIDINDGGAYAGANTAATLDVNITGIEKVVVADNGLDDGGGSGTIITTTITVNAGNTLTALTIDGSALDTHPTTLSGGERLVATASAAAVTEIMTLIGGGFSDSLTGGLAADTLTGNGGADTLIGGGGNDVITGGAGGDAITPGAGIDNASGGAGNDTFTVSTFTDFKTSGGAETLDGGAGTDTITFTEAAALTLTAPEMESLVGIETLDAADTIASAQTTITLGNGFFTSNGSSSITIDGNDTDNVAADHYIDLSAVSNGAVTFYANDTSTAANDSLYGGSGDDTWMVVGTAAASLEATDTFNGNGGTDQFTIVNTTAITAVIDFSLVTNVEKAVVLYNSTGAVDLDLGAVASTDAEPATFTVDGSAVVSSTGTLKFNKTETETNLTTKFTIKGGLNNDTLYGAGGADTITTGAGVNTAGGNGGADTITGGSGIDTLAGDAGADSITGAGGADVITGGSGNDTISGGDGADTITPGSGADNVTGGAGIDTFIYSAATDSRGATADTITDFVSGSDNIRLTHTFPTTQNGTFTLVDRGDAASAGVVPGIMGNVAGDTAFITDEAALAIDLTADGIVNANDFKVILTGATGLTVNDIDVYLTTTEASSVTTAGGSDSITGASAVVHTVYTYSGNDTITLAGDADDFIWAGNGSNTINLGATAGSDSLYLNGGTGKAHVTAFTPGTSDILYLNMDLTTVATGTGVNAVVGTPTADAVADDGAYDFTIGMANTNTIDVVELDEAGSKLPNQANAALLGDYTNNNATQLFKAMANAGANNNIGSITVDNAGDKFYIVAYDDDDQGAHIYYANSAAVLSDTSITVGEVQYVAFIDAAVDDTFVQGALLKMFDFTTINSGY
jgi:Ca2+-binding RTX toxin-like protein